jgi:hypothetical protein
MPSAVSAGEASFGSCEVAHSAANRVGLACCIAFAEGGTISNDDFSDDRGKSRQDIVEPEVAFVDGIVHDEVLRRCSLVVEDLSRVWNVQVGTLDLQPDDVAANDACVSPDSGRVRLDDDCSDSSPLRSINGWAPFLWMRIKAYFSI